MQITIVSYNTQVPATLVFFLMGLNCAPHSLPFDEFDQDASLFARRDLVFYTTKVDDLPDRLLADLARVHDMIIAQEMSLQARLRCERAGFKAVIAFPNELEALRSAIKIKISQHATMDSSPEVYVLDDAVFHSSTLEFRHRDGVVVCTPGEARVLALLIRNANHLVTRSALLQFMGRSSYNQVSRTLDVMISTIRRKLRSVGFEIAIQAVPNLGYRLLGDWHAAATHPMPPPSRTVGTAGIIAGK